MLEVKNKKNYENLFNQYDYSIPLIEASINDDYESHLYLDKEKNPGLAILTTPFYSMYFAGDSSEKGLKETLDKVIFKNHIPTYHQKKLYAYMPSPDWQDVLEPLFISHGGAIEQRYYYVLNKDKFLEISKHLPEIENVKYQMNYRNDRHAKINYPSISAYINDVGVGFSTGYTLRKGVAQIDTHTFKDFRGKNIALNTSQRMIEALLDRGLQVTYICNPSKIGAVKLAEKLGFEKSKEITVFVWKNIKK